MTTEQMIADIKEQVSLGDPDNKVKDFASEVMNSNKGLVVERMFYLIQRGVPQSIINSIMIGAGR